MSEWAREVLLRELGGRHWATSIGAGATYWHFADHLGTERVRATTSFLRKLGCLRDHH